MRLHPSSLQADQPFSGSSLTLSTYMLSHQGFWSLIMLASNLVGGLRPSHLRSFSSLLTTMHTRLRSASVADPSTHPNSLQGGLEASRLGLDPRQNRFHAPLVYHKDYSVDDWPASHTFPMDKFARTAEALLTTCRATHPDSPLPRPLVRDEAHFFRPLDLDAILSKQEWFSIMNADYFQRLVDGQLSVEECRRIGFREQTSRAVVIRRTLLEVAGTVLTAQLALRYGMAANVGGGTHHAHPDGGAGYTLINDLAVTAHVLGQGLMDTGGRLVDKILVIDCDVHQGDGTAQFGRIVPGLVTLSLHAASNYPHPKAQSTYDVGLSDGMGDDEYMEILQASVERALKEVQPDLVLYDAGVDVFVDDTLGRLCLTEQGIRRRDRWVLNRCVEAGIPVAAVIGGGYDKDVAALGRRHAIVHEECSYVWRKHRLWERVI